MYVYMYMYMKIYMYMKELELCCIERIIFSGIFVVMGFDIWLQLERGHLDISKFTKAAISIFIVNILLWIDFNLSIVRRKRQNEPKTSRLRCVKKDALGTI